jgi:ketosteroid isomerase-like protein
MTENTSETDVRALSQAWVDAELTGDPAALERLAAAGFRLVGPVGFVLDRDQWANRYRGGVLELTELSYTDVDVRLHGDTAISIGVHAQKGTHQGNPVDGSFRATHVAVREDGRWRLAGMHLSAIGGPPPFAPRADAAQS